MGELLFHGISTLGDFLLVGTARVVIWCVSGGRWRSESLDEAESRVHAAAGSLSFVHDGQRVVTTSGQLLVGLAFYVLVIACVIAVAIKVGA